MSNQLHGKIFEDFIKPLFPGSADHSRSPSSLFDIEGNFDKQNNLPTNIKSKNINSKIIEMADARKFMSINEPFRLLILYYKQEKNSKNLTKIDEYILNENNISIIKGDLLLDDVDIFHNLLLEFPYGSHIEARDFAKKYKQNLKQKNTYLKLNPKIDSKNQRRLQCSLNINDLNSLIIPSSYNDEYNGLYLPLRIKSGIREF